MRALVLGMLGALTFFVGTVIVRECYSPPTQIKTVVDSLARVVKVQEKLREHYDTVYVNQRQAYTVYRDRILGSDSATHRDTVTFRKVDSLVVACDTVRVVDVRVIHTQDTLTKVLRESPRRVVPFMEGLWSLTDQAPVARAGVEARVYGPVSVTGALDDRLPTVRQGNDLRATIGVRVIF